jgi:hypothetical protein
VNAHVTTPKQEVITHAHFTTLTHLAQPIFRDQRRRPLRRDLGRLGELVHAINSFDFFNFSFLFLLLTLSNLLLLLLLIEGVLH